MTIKHAILTIGAALSVGCAPAPGPIEINGFFPVTTPDCLAEEGGKLQLSSATIDVNSGRARYLVGVSLIGLDQFAAGAIIRSDGKVLDIDKRDNAFIDELAVSYRATPSIGSFKSEVLKVAGGGQGASKLMMTQNIITQSAADVIAGIAPSDNAADVVTLNVTVEYRGRLTRSGTRVSSGQWVFPLKLRRLTKNECPQPTGGPSGYKYLINECLTNGQFSSPGASCCDPASPTTDGECLTRGS